METSQVYGVLYKLMVLGVSAGDQSHSARATPAAGEMRLDFLLVQQLMV